MSIFKTKGIILKIDIATPGDIKSKSGDFFYTIFTKDYGKIKCITRLNKKEKSLDIGYIINFEIITNEELKIHKIRNIKISSEYNSLNKTFSEINAYLIILSIVNKKVIRGSPIYELFDLLETINSTNDINHTKLILARLKIISIFGELNENNSDPIISKILKFINSNKIDRILKLTGIGEEVKKQLEII